jgi:hypothetical protein
MPLTPDQPPGNRYVLVHQDKRVADFLTLQEAFENGVRLYGAPPFTVIDEWAEEGGSEESSRGQYWTPRIIDLEPDLIIFKRKRPWNRSDRDYPPQI